MRCNPINFRLKDIREDNDLKQIEVANKLNVTKSTYANWEAETVNIPLAKLNEFFNQFKISMDYVSMLTNIKSKDIDYSLDLSNKTIKERLTIIENELSKTQKDMANLLGIVESTYSKYKSVNTIQTLMPREISSKFNYSMDWIIGKTDSKELNK